jgi:hypothetical protein
MAMSARAAPYAGLRVLAKALNPKTILNEERETILYSMLKMALE